MQIFITDKSRVAQVRKLLAPLIVDEDDNAFEFEDSDKDTVEAILETNDIEWAEAETAEDEEEDEDADSDDEEDDNY